VIETFGQFVVGGNFVVGVVVFLILLVIQLMVVTKGAGRIAEVAARFVLDAMPGKQMAIDADLNAGMISEKEARERRAKIINAEGEAQAAAKLAEAADVISRNPVTIQLRYLQTLLEIGNGQNSTIVFPLPIDLIGPPCFAHRATTCKPRVKVKASPLRTSFP